jgi:uncharacterized protein YfaS (alpha-2-macroglobulin family)
MIDVFQGNVLNIPITILEDKQVKDLAGLSVKAAIEAEDGTTKTIDCTINESGLVLFPLTTEETSVLGIYRAEIQFYVEETYKESWGTFVFRIIKSIFLEEMDLH